MEESIISQQVESTIFKKNLKISIRPQYLIREHVQTIYIKNFQVCILPQQLTIQNSCIKKTKKHDPFLNLNTGHQKNPIEIDLFEIKAG